MSKFSFSRISIVLVFPMLLSGCQSVMKQFDVRVRNPSDFNRKEVIAVAVPDHLKDLSIGQLEKIRVKRANTDHYLVTQWVDENADGKPEALLFHAEIGALQTVRFTVVKDNKKEPMPESVAYSRFVPERLDDYAWENDKVAFRAYGPEAQRRAEQQLPDGMLSSGIDLWLKRTEESIIDTWYAGHVKTPGFYHTDRGQGYDPYHVGASRGTGGTGVWHDEKLEVSKNFIAYRTLANGPLRTTFELDYAPWGTFGVRETKRISLDVGSNFSKFEIRYSSEKPLPNYAFGISLQQKKGTVIMDKDKGWVGHVETIDGELLTEGIVLDPASVQRIFPNRVSVADQSNLLVLVNPVGKITYYAGFAWRKSGQIKEFTDWNKLLDQQAIIIASPLEVTIRP